MNATDRVSRALDVFLLTHPMRTTVGLLLATVVEGAIKVAVWKGVPAPPVSVLHVTAFCVLCAHFPTIVSLFRGRPAWDESIQNALAIVDHARQQGLPDYQVRAMYLDICEKVLARIQLSESAARDLEHLRRITGAETSNEPTPG